MGSIGSVSSNIVDTYQASTHVLKLTYPYPLCPSNVPSGAGEYFM